jgi:hypothetical protein
MTQPNPPDGGQNPTPGGSGPSGDPRPPQFAPMPQPPMPQPPVTGGPGFPGGPAGPGGPTGPGGPQQPKKKGALPWVIGSCVVLVVIAIVVSIVVIWGLYKVGKATDDAKSASPSPTAEQTTDPGESDGGGSTDPGDSAAPDDFQPVTEADIDPAKQVVIDVYDKIGERDWSGACANILDPTTGTGAGPGTPNNDACVKSLKDALGDDADDYKDSFSKDILDGKVQGDKIVLSVQGDESVTVDVVKGSDGTLYADFGN